MINLRNYLCQGRKGRLGRIENPKEVANSVNIPEGGLNFILNEKVAGNVSKTRIKRIIMLLWNERYPETLYEGNPRLEESYQKIMETLMYTRYFHDNLASDFLNMQRALVQRIKSRSHNIPYSPKTITCVGEAKAVQSASTDHQLIRYC
jgi:hypothetical protein